MDYLCADPGISEAYGSYGVFLKWAKEGCQETLDSQSFPKRLSIVVNCGIKSLRLGVIFKECMWSRLKVRGIDLYC